MTRKVQFSFDERSLLPLAELLRCAPTPPTLANPEPRWIDVAKLFTDAYCDCHKRGASWPSCRANYHLPDCALSIVEQALSATTTP